MAKSSYHEQRHTIALLISRAQLLIDSYQGRLNQTKDL